MSREDHDRDVCRSRIGLEFDQPARPGAVRQREVEDNDVRLEALDQLAVKQELARIGTER